MKFTLKSDSPDDIVVLALDQKFFVDVEFDGAGNCKKFFFIKCQSDEDLVDEISRYIDPNHCRKIKEDASNFAWHVSHLSNSLRRIKLGRQMMVHPIHDDCLGFNLLGGFVYFVPNSFLGGECNYSICFEPETTSKVFSSCSLDEATLDRDIIHATLVNFRSRVRTLSTQGDTFGDLFKDFVKLPNGSSISNKLKS